MLNTFAKLIAGIITTLVLIAAIVQCEEKLDAASHPSPTEVIKTGMPPVQVKLLELIKRQLLHGKSVPFKWGKRSQLPSAPSPPPAASAKKSLEEQCVEFLTLFINRNIDEMAYLQKTDLELAYYGCFRYLVPKKYLSQSDEEELADDARSGEEYGSEKRNVPFRWGR